MQNQENSENKKMTKQEYNRRYYEKNKHRWNGEKKLDLKLGNVFHLFSKLPFQTTPTNDPIASWIPFLKRLQIRVLICFVIVATFYLIYEAAKFYLDEQEGTVLACAKAIMIEGFAILLSFSRCRSTLLKWIRNLIVIILCAFTLLVMSGKAVKTASSDTVKAQILRDRLQQLSSELAQKEQLRQAFVSKNMLTTARRYEKGIELVNAKLEKVQDEISAEHAPEVITNNLRILILFRFILAIVNLASIHVIVEYFKPDSPLPEAKKVSQLAEFS